MTTETLQEHYNQKISEFENKLYWLKRMQDRLTWSNNMRDCEPFDQFVKRYTSVIKYTSPDSEPRLLSTFAMQEPLSPRIISDLERRRKTFDRSCNHYSQKRHELTVDSLLHALHDLKERRMEQETYKGWTQYFGIKPEEPSNPVEERPTIIYPDAQQYKADMQRLAEGLEKRLGAVKV